MRLVALLLGVHFVLGFHPVVTTRRHNPYLAENSQWRRDVRKSRSTFFAYQSTFRHSQLASTVPTTTGYGYLNSTSSISPQSFDPLNLQTPPSISPPQPFTTTKSYSRILVLVAAMLYGTNFSCVKILDTQIDIASGAALRFGIAALAASPFLWWNTKPSSSSPSSSPPPSNLPSIISGLEVGVWNGAGYLAQAAGLETTSASKSAFICSLAVVVVPILDRVFGGKKLQPRTTLGCILALIGVGMLELPHDFISQFGKQQISITEGFAMVEPGDLATYLQPVTFGVGFWRMEKAMNEHPNDALRLTASQLLSVFLVSTIYMMTGGGGVEPPTISVLKEWLTDPSILSALVWTGLVTTAFTVWLETMALKNLTASETTMLFSTEPVWGSLFATVVMGEAFGIQGMVGAGIIMGACVYSSWNNGEENSTLTESVTSSSMSRAASPALVTSGVLTTTVVSDLQANIDFVVEGVEETIGDVVTDVVTETVEKVGDLVDSGML